MPILRRLRAQRALGNIRLKGCLVAAMVAFLALPVAARAENEFANPGVIEGVVTKAGGGPLKGVEVCTFDVAEDEEFTECAYTKSNGAYEILGLDEGPYRVTFMSGESGLNLATQYWKGAAAPGKATIVRVEEGKADTGIDAAMTVAGGAAESGAQDGCPQSAEFQGACPTISFAPTYSVGPHTIHVTVRSSATTPVAVTGASPGPGILHGAKRLRRGTPTSIAVPISDSILARLRRLDPGRAIRLRLRAHATDVAGAPSSDHLIVRLPGRA